MLLMLQILNFVLGFNAIFIFSKLIQDYHILIILINISLVPNLIIQYHYIYLYLNM